MNLIKRNSLAVLLTVAGALAAGTVRPALAQTVTAPAGTPAVAGVPAAARPAAVAGTSAVGTPAAVADTRLFIEFKDVSLYDALETIFLIADNPSHTINEAAKSVYVTSVVFNNAAWDAGVRQLATQNNFTVTRSIEGTYNIQPRVFNQFGRGGMNGMGGGRRNRGNRGGAAGGAGTAPGNPFGGGAAGGNTFGGGNFGGGNFNGGGNFGGRGNNFGG